MLQAAGRRTAPGLGCVAMLLAAGVQAGNGLNDVGYGSESAGMAGADIAVARDTTALNSNPAGLTQIGGRVLDLFVEPYYLDSRHKDEFGNDDTPTNAAGSGIGGGYAQRLAGTPLVVGVGMFFQGGSGFVYPDLQTAFGTRDELSSIFGSLKIAPGIAWQASEQLSLGAAIGLLYSTARQKVLYETSTANFSGSRIDGLAGFSANIKLGLQYRPDPDWVLALVYTSKAPLRLENGEMHVNNTGSGGGHVRYSDVSISGLAFAPEVAVGARWRASESLQLTAELSWLDWSSSMQSSTLRVGAADDPEAPALAPIVSPLNWDDQALLSIGGLWRFRPASEFIFGASYARQPIPSSSLGPTFALLGEASISAGLIHQLTPTWHFLGSATWQPPVTKHYSNPLFGKSSERWNAVALYLTLSRRW